MDEHEDMSMSNAVDVYQGEDGNLRGKMINQQTKIIDIVLSKSDGECPRGPDISTELKNTAMLIDLSQRNIRDYTSTIALNTETQGAFEEILSSIETTEEELQKELNAANIRLQKAKQSLDYIMDTYFPENAVTIRRILEDLEEASKSVNEEDKYREINFDVRADVLFLLLRSKCLVVHPTKLSYFKLAPLI